MLGTQGREAIGDSRQQLMDHAGRRVPDISNWRRRCVKPDFVLAVAASRQSVCAHANLCVEFPAPHPPRRDEHERDRRLVIQKKIEELTKFMNQCEASRGSMQKRHA